MNLYQGSYLPVGQETHPLSYLQAEVGCLTFLLARKHIPSATCRQKLAVLLSCWPGNTSPQLPADRSWLSYLPIGQETHPLYYLQTEVGCLTFLLARKHIPSTTCRQKLAALPSYWTGNTSPQLPADRSWLPYLPVGKETHPLSYLQTEVGCLTFLLARKHTTTCRQKMAALPSCWTGNTSPPLPADRRWLPYLPVGQETHPLHYLQTEVGCLTFLLARKHIPSATCGQKLAVLPSYWPGNIPSATCRQKLAALPFCWPGNTSPQLPADRNWLPYLPVGQETHPLHYLQTEVGCLTFLLARKHILCTTCRQKLAVLPSHWPGNTSPPLPADRSWLPYLPIGQETHPLSYLQAEVGCLTFLLARKHIPSATCRQKLAVLPSYWPGNTSSVLPADRSWPSYLPVGQETHPLHYLQTEVGCLTFLLDRKHIPSATCRQKLAVLLSYWPGNTSPQLPADRSWLSYLPIGQETHPLYYLQTEVGCLTFPLARKHIPSTTCRQKLAALPSYWTGNTSPQLPADRSWLPYLPVGKETHPSATCRQKLAALPSCWQGNTQLLADRRWLPYLPVGQETHPLHYLQTEDGCLTFLLDRKHIPSTTCRQKLAVLPSYWPGNTSPQLPVDRSWLSYLPIGQ